MYFQAVPGVAPRSPPSLLIARRSCPGNIIVSVARTYPLHQIVSIKMLLLMRSRSFFAFAHEDINDFRVGLVRSPIKIVEKHLLGPGLRPFAGTNSSSILYFLPVRWIGSALDRYLLYIDINRQSSGLDHSTAHDLWTA